jgi:hypothetical protein
VLEVKTRRARAVGVLVALAALPGLAACSPGDRALIAVGTAGGEPVVLLAGCDDFQIDSVTVYTQNDEASPRRDLSRTGSELPGSMPLFGDPVPGWKVTGDQLTGLSASGSYGLAAYDGASRAVPIGFEAADLATLGAGEVLVGKPPGGHEKVTEREFRKRAEDDC